MSRMEDFGFWLSRTFASSQAKRREWPYVPGTYRVVDPAAPVAVTTLGSVALAGAVARQAPAGLCIVGKVETENIGIEKIIRNVISNPAIRFFICAGPEPPKHLAGATLLALFRNGVDDAMRIRGAPGMRPVLPNASAAEVDAFRAQLEPVDMIGCTEVGAIHARIAELADRTSALPALGAIAMPAVPGTQGIERVIAMGADPNRIKLDKQGYFVISIESGALLVEHYSYREKLLRVIEGADARSIYLTVVRNGWVSQLDHACYLGRELARAERCLRDGAAFVQDGA